MRAKYFVVRPVLKGLFFLIAAFSLWLNAPATVSAANPDYDLALQQYQDNDWYGAISNFTKSIAVSNNLYDCYSYRAYARAKLNESNDAIADCNAMIKLDPTAGFYWRARIEEMFTNLDAALTDYQNGLQTNPAGKPDQLVADLCADYTTQSYVRFQAGDLTNALASVNEAISLSTTNRQWARYFHGFLEMRLGDYDSALVDEDFVLANWPDDLDARRARAWAHFGAHQRMDALADCEQVIKVINSVQPVNTDPVRYPILLEMQGLECLIKGDYTGAQDNWNTFLNGTAATTPADRSFYQAWIDRAKEWAKNH